MTSLFDFDQPGNLRRVTGAIGGAVLGFVRERGVGATFHAQELKEYVAARTMIAPESPGRVLRDLKGQGFFDYRVLNRRQSYYEITAVRTNHGN